MNEPLWHRTAAVKQVKMTLKTVYRICPNGSPLQGITRPRRHRPFPVLEQSESTEVDAQLPTIVDRHGCPGCQVLFDQAGDFMNDSRDVRAFKTF